MDKTNEDIFVTIITNEIKQNILEHPKKRFWAGVLMYDSKEYYYEIIEKDFPTLMDKN